MNNKKRHISRMIMKVTAAIAVLTFSTPVHAGTSIESEGIDKNQKGTITVNRAPESGWPVNRTVFHLYQVADLKDDMTFAYTDAFKGKAKKNILPSASVMPDSRWESSTDALMKVVNQNNIQPLETLNWNNASDHVVFSNLNIGLYLLTSDPITYNHTKYVSSGNLISVPYRSSNTESWTYAYSVEVKHTEETVKEPTTPVSPTPGTKTSPSPSPSSEVTPVPSPSSSTEVSPSPSIEKTPVPSENTTEEKENPSPGPSSPSEKPDTGDHSHTGLYAGALIAMVVIIGIVIYVRKEERKN